MEMEEQEDEEQEEDSKTPAKDRKEGSKPPLQKKFKRPKAKTGPKNGSGNQAKWSGGDWYEACHAYVNQQRFLASDKSPKCFDGRKSQCVSFV
jgi:hypothetical protein